LSRTSQPAGDPEFADATRSWRIPPQVDNKQNSCQELSVEEIVEYLEVFFHGMKVRKLDEDLTLTFYDRPDSPPKKHNQGIGKKTSDF
jgi:hypothetical protein